MQDRLKELMLRENLTAAQLAKIIDVNPSTISHITIGRSNPKIEFIQKLLLGFPQLNPNWVIMGAGEMYISSHKENEISSQVIDQDNFQAISGNSLFPDNEIEVTNVIQPKVTELKDLNDESKHHTSKKNVDSDVEGAYQQIPSAINTLKASRERKIEQILVFYSDKSYEQFLMNE